MTETVTQIDPKQRAFLLSLDQFAIDNWTELKKTFETMKPMTSAGNGFDSLLSTYEASLHCEHFREASALENLPGAIAMLFVVAWRHLTLGTPAYINDTLLAAWYLSGQNSAECKACGYLVPVCPAFTACPVCKGQLGAAGERERNREAAKAWVN